MPLGVATEVEHLYSLRFIAKDHLLCMGYKGPLSPAIESLCETAQEMHLTGTAKVFANSGALIFSAQYIHGVMVQ